MAKSGCSGLGRGRSALPPGADLRAATSALAPISSASSHARAIGRLAPGRTGPPRTPGISPNPLPSSLPPLLWKPILVLCAETSLEISELRAGAPLLICCWYSGQVELALWRRRWWLTCIAASLQPGHVECDHSPSRVGRCCLPVSRKASTPRRSQFRGSIPSPWSPL